MPASGASRLFLYGTLIDASDTAAARWLRPRLLSTRPASVPGRLFAIPTAHGWFPALLPACGRRVKGLCCQFSLTRADLAWLDCYEGRDYCRATARVLVGSSLVTAQLYCWQRTIPPGARMISDGDFLNWLGRHRLRAYGDSSRR